MAAGIRKCLKVCSVLMRSQSSKAFSTTVARNSEEDKGFLSNLFGLQQVVKATDAHSKVLTQRDILYEIECKLSYEKYLAVFLVFVISLRDLSYIKIFCRRL